MRFSQISLIAALAAASASPALAQHQKLPPGYTLEPSLSYEKVSQDPEGVWVASELKPLGNPPRYPSIYTARVGTPVGEWLLSQTTSGCSLESDCPFQLVLKRSDGSKVTVAGGMLAEGGKAVLSMDYTKLFAETYNGIETFPVKVSK
jgi:hypothetical protein